MVELIWLQEHNIDLVEVDGKLFDRIAPLPRTLSTVELGRKFRFRTDLDKKDINKSVGRHVIYIPDYCDVTPSFVQGLFGDSIWHFGRAYKDKEVGLEEFLAKYSFRHHSVVDYDENRELLLRKDILKLIKSLI